MTLAEAVQTPQPGPYDDRPAAGAEKFYGDYFGAFGMTEGDGDRPARRGEGAGLGPEYITSLEATCPWPPPSASASL